MLYLHCWAIVSDKEKREELLSKLRHHNTPYVEKDDKVSIDANFLSYRSVDKLIEYFDNTGATERGVSIIADKEDIKYDSG